MKYFLVDDDENVLDILELLVEEHMGGTVCGRADNGADALEDIFAAAPDIVLVDLLMPVLDGIGFVQAARQRLPAAQFVMLSQVSDKELVARAYESGVEFFVQKPVNGIEVQNVLRRVEEKAALRSTFAQMQSLVVGAATPAATARQAVKAPAGAGSAAAAAGRGAAPQPFEEHCGAILNALGIGGDTASKDIRQMAAWLAAHPDETPTVAELCAMQGQSPKTVEQRLRRAVNAGLVNLACLGIEDYGNEAFVAYAGTLYRFEQVRREMHRIRSGAGERGKASLRHFLYALAALARE